VLASKELNNAKEVINMNGSPQARKFQRYQNIYFKISLGVIALGVILFGIGWIFANKIAPAPAILLLLACFLCTITLHTSFMALAALCTMLEKSRIKSRMSKQLKQ
jgi:hypothetical protein